MGGRSASLEDSGLEGRDSGRRGHAELSEQVRILLAEAPGVVAGAPDLDNRRPVSIGTPDDPAQAALGQPSVAFGAIVHLLVAVKRERALPLKQGAERHGWPPSRQRPRPSIPTGRSPGD